MKIALINENSQKKKNELIFKILEKVAKRYGHEVFNYGVREDSDYKLDYVGAGILSGILLGSKAVDFVISGCSTGEGLLITANKMPGVICGYVNNPVDVELFLRINGGNAISIPYGMNFGVGFEINLENILHTLFQTEAKSGYPIDRKEIQNDQLKKLKYLDNLNHQDLYQILDKMDKDLLYHIIKNSYFEENFFAHSQDDNISELLKDLIDL